MRLSGLGGNLDQELGPVEFQRRQFGHDGLLQRDGRGTAQSGQPRGRAVIGIARGGCLLFERCQPLLAGVEIGKIRGHRVASPGEVVDGYREFARRGAQRKKPLLGPFEFLRIEFGCPQRHLHAGLRGVERDQRLVERRHDVVEHVWRFRRLALQPAQEARKLRQRRILAGEHVLRILDLGRDLFDPHHRGADAGELCLLTRLRIEPDEFGHRCPEIVGLARGGLHARAVLGQLLLAVAPEPPGRAAIVDLADMAPKGVEQFAMGGSVDQSAFVVLSVDLDKRAADVAHQRDAGRLIVDEDAGAAVGGLHAAQDDVAVVVQRVFGEDGARGMVLRHVEDSRHLALGRAVADQGGIAARAERQRQGIKQDGFAGAGLAGEDREAGRKIDVQPLDQDDIADRQAGQHSGNFFEHDLFRKPVPTFRDHAVFKHDLFRNWLPPFGIMLQIVRPPKSCPALEIHEPAFSRGSSPPVCSSA